MTLANAITLLGVVGVVVGATWIHPGFGIIMFGVFLVITSTHMQRQAAIAAVMVKRDEDKEKTQH